MKRLLETNNLTSNSQKHTQVITTDDRSHEHDLQRESVTVRGISANIPLPQHVWHCSEYDF